ncbi:unnamed protein product [Jaminaea pallidilutea]
MLPLAPLKSSTSESESERAEVKDGTAFERATQYDFRPRSTSKTTTSEADCAKRKRGAIDKDSENKSGHLTAHSTIIACTRMDCI